MKRKMLVVAFAGILVLALTATTFAAREPDGVLQQPAPTAVPPAAVAPALGSGDQPGSSFWDSRSSRTCAAPWGCVAARGWAAA